MRYIESYKYFLVEQNTNLVEVKPNKYVYHTSNPIFRDNIAKEGLIPKGKSDNTDDWVSWDYDDDIYKIDTSKLNNKWYSDPNFGLDNKKYIITFEKIPLDSIKIIHKGTGNEIH